MQSATLLQEPVEPVRETLSWRIAPENSVATLTDISFIYDLEPQTTIYKWMFGETTIFYIKIWNHPIETPICKWLFGVPGSYSVF